MRSSRIAFLIAFALTAVIAESFAVTNVLEQPRPMQSPVKMFEAPSLATQAFATNQSILDKSAATMQSAATTSSLSVGEMRPMIMETLSMGSRTLVGNPLLNINFTCVGQEKTGMAAVGQSDYDVWNNYIFLGADWAIMENLVWSDSTASDVTMTVENAPGLWGNGSPDPMYNTFIYPWEEGDIVITFENIPEGIYDFYLYGHSGSDDGNSVFELWSGTSCYGQRGTTIWGSGWDSTNWEEGQQYVVYRNVQVQDLSPVTLILLPGASGYVLANGIQIVPSAAVQSEPMQIERLLNINFTCLGQEKSGMAAIGQDENDVWNNYIFLGYYTGVMGNLLWSDGSSSGIGLTVQNGPGLWGNGSPDPMYNTYIYPWNWGSITVTLTGIPEGVYDFYVYGHGPSEEGNSVFELWSGTTTHGLRGTSIWGDGWDSTNWEEGQQYVVYRNVSVSSAETVVLDVPPGASGYALINGIQIVLPLDRDADGLPDWWERQYFGHIGVDPDADPDGDGMSNLAEYQYGSNPTDAYSFNLAKNDAEYFFAARAGEITGMLRLYISDQGNGQLRFDVSGGFPNRPYDLYYVREVVAQRWQWRRVYCDAKCDSAGTAMFLLQKPDAVQGFFVLLDAADDDSDGLGNGYEAWFKYSGRHSSMSLRFSDNDNIPDGWEVAYGLDPTDGTNPNGNSGNPDSDAYSNLQEYNKNHYCPGIDRGQLDYGQCLCGVDVGRGV